MGKIIVTLDPGHVKGYNKGILASYYEGTAMYTLAVYLKEELEKFGLFEVYITRKNVDDNPSLTNRGKLAIIKKSDVFISLHSDAYSVATAVGISVFRSVRKPNSKELGDLLGNAITDLMRIETGVTRYRGCVINLNSAGNDYYGVIREAAKGTTVDHVYIIEHGFHTNQKECTFLNNNVNLRKLAQTEALVLYNYFSKESNVKTYGVITPIMGHGNAANAMSNVSGGSLIPVGQYTIYREHSSGAINITTDKTGKNPGWWINPNNNVISVEVIDILLNIKGYSNADNAMKDKDATSVVPAGQYYIYRTHSSGAINITTDKTGKTPGWWINPDTNVKGKTPEEKEAELDTSNLTKITMSWDNRPTVTPEQVVAYVKSKTKDYKLTCTLEELVYDFIRAGYIENIRWDIAFAQSIHETGFFRYGGQVSPEQNNYSGLGATNDGAKGATFETPFLGALAQIQHLKAYCNKEEVGYKENVDPRFQYVTRGWAPYLEWLGAGENPKNGIYNKNLGWAVPGKTYGQSILKVLEEIEKM